MRAFLSAITAAWQPVAVIGGTLTAITGATATAATHLGAWPGATVGGALTAGAAIVWNRYTITEELSQ